MSETSLPHLPSELSGLTRYLLQRDGAAPSNLPHPGAITTTNPGVGAMDMDVIEWEYTQGDPLMSGRGADAFVIWWQTAETSDPTESSVIVPLAARCWVNVVPHGMTRSYAIAAIRWGHRGMESTQKNSVKAWQGIT